MSIGFDTTCGENPVMQQRRIGCWSISREKLPSDWQMGDRLKCQTILIACTLWKRKAHLLLECIAGVLCRTKQSAHCCLELLSVPEAIAESLRCTKSVFTLRTSLLSRATIVTILLPGQSGTSVSKSSFVWFFADRLER